MSRSARAGALLVAIVLAAGCGPTVTVTPSPTAAPSTASPSLSAGPSLPALSGWQEVTLPSDDDTVLYTTVVGTPAGFVAAGYGVRPVAWSSPDGEAWTEEPIPGDSRNPTDAIWWGDRLLMVGAGGFGPGCGHPFAIDTWVRDGPGLWNQAPFQQIFCAGGEVSVAVAGGLAVIVGAGTGDVPYAWSSNDGLHWVDHPEAFDQDLGLPLKLLATPAGFVALGRGQERAWFERSQDGARWQDLVNLPGPTGASPLGATVVGTRLVVILGASSGPVVRLSSEEPSTWAVDTTEGLVAESVLRIEPMEGGLVAIGGDEGGPSLWVSADGLSWRRVDMPGTGTGGYLTDVAAGHGRVVLLGGAETGGGGLHPAAWVGPTELLAP